MAKKLYQGSCDCKKVRFEVELDLTKGTYKCNCRICWKLRFWCVLVPIDKFKLLAGQGELTSYGTKLTHQFCRHCGVKVFGGPADGSRKAISVAALDDLDPEELLRAPIRYTDGLRDRWDEAPAFTAHL